MRCGNALRIHESPVENHSRIQRRIHCEVRGHRAVPRHVKFGANQRHRPGESQRETFPLSGISKNARIIELHRLPVVIHLHHYAIEEISAQSSLIRLPHLSRKIVTGNYRQSEERKLHPGQRQHRILQRVRSGIAGYFAIHRTFFGGRIQFKKNRLAAVETRGQENQNSQKHRRNLRGISSEGKVRRHDVLRGSRRRRSRRRGRSLLLCRQRGTRSPAAQHNAASNQVLCAAPIHHPSRDSCKYPKPHASANTPGDYTSYGPGARYPSREKIRCVAFLPSVANGWPLPSSTCTLSAWNCPSCTGVIPSRYLWRSAAGICPYSGAKPFSKTEKNARPPVIAASE